MNINSILKDCAIDVIAAAAAAGTTTVTSSVLDMSGWDGVLFIAKSGDATSGTVLTLAALGNTANATGGTAAAITGATCTYTSLSATDADDKTLMVDVVRPVKRYIYVTLARATQNCECSGIIAIRYRGNKAPVTQGASCIASAIAAAS
jgi:hypothetical protein